MKRLKDSEIEVGSVYSTTVGRNVVHVRIVEARADGKGWNATYVASGRPVHIKTVNSLRAKVSHDEPVTAEAEAPVRQIVSRAEYEQQAGTARKARKERRAASGAVKVMVEPKAKQASGLDLAALVLAEAATALSAKDICERVLAKGWKTEGKTPEATLYSAIFTEIKKKGAAARFQKVGRGLFAITGGVVRAA